MRATVPFGESTRILKNQNGDIAMNVHTEATMLGAAQKVVELAG